MMSADPVDAVVAAFRAEGMKGSRAQMERFARAAVETCERDTVRLVETLRELVDAGEPFVGDAFPAEKLDGRWLRIFNRWQAAMNDGRRDLGRDRRA